MSSNKRVVVGVVAAIILMIALQPGFLVISGAWLYSEIMWQIKSPQLPDIARNLPSSFAAGKVEFNDRVQREFPIGTPEQDLIARLSTLGFVVSSAKQSSVIMFGRFPCNLRWQVSWKADETRKITEIVGNYGEAGCL